MTAWRMFWLWVFEKIDDMFGFDDGDDGNMPGSYGGTDSE